MMELHILPPLVVFEVNALLGVFALSRSRGDSQHRYFAGFALAAGLWCLGSMLYFLMPKEFREVGLRLGFVGGTIIPAIYGAAFWARRPVLLGPKGPQRDEALVIFYGAAIPFVLMLAYTLAAVPLPG